MAFNSRVSRVMVHLSLLPVCIYTYQPCFALHFQWYFCPPHLTKCSGMWLVFFPAIHCTFKTLYSNNSTIKEDGTNLFSFVTINSYENLHLFQRHLSLARADLFHGVLSPKDSDFYLLIVELTVDRNNLTDFLHHLF